MEINSIVEYAVPAAFFLFVAFAVFSALRAARRVRMDAERNEALFRSMFPDLQPLFHPEKLVQFVNARRSRGAATSASVWKAPPGFAADRAEIQPDGAREKVRLLDAAGALLADFLFEDHPEGGVLRYGKGKFTVNVRDAVPRVRYWHPDREFKWSRKKGWWFFNRMAEESFSSSDRSYSDSSSSSSDSRGAAAAAGIVAAGGTFDGGGASQAWDDGGRGAESSTSAAESAPATSY